MEVSFQVQRPFTCRKSFSEGTQLKIKPLLGCFSYGRPNNTSPSSTWCRELPGSRVSSHIIASGDYPRRRQRKNPASKTKDPVPRGFSQSSAPKSQARTNTQKRGQSETNEAKEDSDISNSSESNQDQLSKLETAVHTSSENHSIVDGSSKPTEKSSIKMRSGMLPYKLLLNNLAEENLTRGNMVFSYPEVATAGEVIEVFLNRRISALKDEPNILMMGGFNDWRWQSFTKPLHRTELQGDWWSCGVNVPKESYKMDFVFFNGGEVYENNKSNDFSISVEGGMNILSFEDFLLEEKRRELEKLAAEQAEKEKQAAELQQLEAEKSASEADKAQAKIEVNKRREQMHQVMQKALDSVENLWFIEPSKFKGGDMVRLYYNRSSRSLAHADEVWIHGGYNNWKDGLVIVKRLIRSETKIGDWWFADGMLARTILFF